MSIIIMRVFLFRIYPEVVINIVELKWKLNFYIDFLRNISVYI